MILSDATQAAYSGERAINGVYYAFNIIFDGKNATAEQIYTKARYELRQDLGQSITAPDPANYLMDSTVLTIKNISGSATKLTGGWGRDPNTSDTMDIIDLTGDPIFTNPPHVVAYSASGSSTESDYLSIDDYNIPL